MNTISKVLIPNKEWIIEQNGTKIGSLEKRKKGFTFFKKGIQIQFKSLNEIKDKLGLDNLEFNVPISIIIESTLYDIYDYPCRTKPYEPVFDVRRKLPLFTKSAKSKSKYCAGYYVIKFKKGWVKSFCPKLITIDRYPFKGPFKTEQDMKNMLIILNKS